MKTIPLCTHDIRKLVQAGAKPKNFELPRELKFEVGISVDDELQKAIETDDRLANKIFAEVSKEYKATVKQLVNLTKFIDAQAATQNRDKLAKQWGVDTAGYFDDAEAKMVSAAEKLVKAWLKTRDIRKKYKIKAASKIAVGTLGLATATIGAVVSVPTGGAGAVVAIIAGGKALRNLYKELKVLAQSLDTAERNLRKHLTKLTQSYRDNTRGGVAAKELLAAAFTQVTTLNAVSISVCEKEYSTFDGKLAGVEIKTSEAGTKLHKLLDDQSKLQKLIDDKIKKQLTSRGYKSKRLPKLETQLEKLARLTEAQRKTAKAIYKKADGAGSRKQGYENALKLLKAKKPDWVKWAEAALKLTDLAMGAAVTDFSAVEQIIVLADSILVELDDVLVEEL